MKFSQKIEIGSKIISKNNPVFIIAEAGVNHNGDMDIAKKLIDIAVNAGADAVKFQTFKAQHLILKEVRKASYQMQTTNSNESQYEMLKRLEVSKEQNLELLKYAKEQEIIFLSTPFEEKSLEELCELQIAAIKIAATDITNIQFLREVAKKNLPMILSAGMCYMQEVEAALRAIYPYNKDVILLQCTANYPIKNEEVNLNVLHTFEQKFNLLTGYSDHSVGVGAAPFAVPMGAKVIEKHFTLDKSMIGPDHQASLNPDELREMIKLIRKVECYMGTFLKTPTLSECQTRKSLQKCLVARTNIKKGEKFTVENIVAKRTDGEGISAFYIDGVLNKIANKDFKVNEIITL